MWQRNPTIARVLLVLAAVALAPGADACQPSALVIERWVLALQARTEDGNAMDTSAAATTYVYAIVNTHLHPLDWQLWMDGPVDCDFSAADVHGSGDASSFPACVNHDTEEYYVPQP